MELTEEIKNILAKDGWKLENYPDLQNNKEAVLIAVKRSGWTLQYASKKLRGNKEVVLEAVKQYARALEFASYDLRNDIEVVLEAIKQDGYCFNFVSNKLYKEFVDLIIKHLKK